MCNSLFLEESEERRKCFLNVRLKNVNILKREREETLRNLQKIRMDEVRLNELINNTLCL